VKDYPNTRKWLRCSNFPFFVMKNIFLYNDSHIQSRILNLSAQLFLVALPTPHRKARALRSISTKTETFWRCKTVSSPLALKAKGDHAHETVPVCCRRPLGIGHWPCVERYGRVCRRSVGTSARHSKDLLHRAAMPASVSGHPKDPYPQYFLSIDLIGLFPHVSNQGATQ
jgi:hypothetical protein